MPAFHRAQIFAAGFLPQDQLLQAISQVKAIAGDKSLSAEAGMDKIAAVLDHPDLAGVLFGARPDRGRPPTPPLPTTAREPSAPSAQPQDATTKNVSGAAAAAPAPRSLGRDQPTRFSQKWPKSRLQQPAAAPRWSRPAAPKAGRWCTPEEMQSGQGLVSMNGTAASLPARRYNRGCKLIRSNYKCGRSPGYDAYLKADNLRQVPAAAAEGKCALYTNEGQYPFPAGSSILFWGNSHLREVITAILCQYVQTCTPSASPRTRGDACVPSPGWLPASCRAASRSDVPFAGGSSSDS